MIRDRCCSEQFTQQGTAGLREFIQRQAGAGDPGENRQHPGAGRGLEYQVVGPEPRRLGHDGRKGQRG